MTKYTAHVYGIVWAGYKASTSYDFNQLPSREDVMERAEDFQQVTRIKVTKTTVTVEPCRLALA